MQRRYSFGHFVLAIVLMLSLTFLMVCVDAQARIAFGSDRDGNSEIYVMNADGTNQRRLTNHPKNDWSPSWSPDGKRIAFMSDRDEHAHPIHDWRSPTSEIYVMDANGGNQQNLTNDPHNDRSPSWSPDGKHIVFSSDRDGHFRSRFGTTSEIYVMDADGGNQQNITNNPSADKDPSWSPNGKRIAFSSTRNGQTDIYVMDANGGNQQNITNHPDRDWHPSWSPDGERIAFVSSRTRDLNRDIYVMDADGGNPRNLTNHPEDDEDPAWLNPVLSVAPADKKLTIWGRLKQGDR